MALSRVQRRLSTGTLVPPDQPVNPSPRGHVFGLIDRQNSVPAGREGDVDGIVVKLPWAYLQPTEGAALPAPADLLLNTGNPLTQGQRFYGLVGTAANLADTIAAAELHGWWIKVRIYTGWSAPMWAKLKDGTVLKSFIDPIDGGSGTCPRWWLPGYQAAYQGLITAVAAAWEDQPRIREVLIAGATTKYVEPGIRQPEHYLNRRQYIEDYGLTKAADRASHHHAIDIHRTTLTQLASVMSFSPHQTINETPKATPAPDGGTDYGQSADKQFSISSMDYLFDTMGAYGTAMNNALTLPEKANLLTIYDRLKFHGAAGRAIGFQTEPLAGTGQHGIDSNYVNWSGNTEVAKSGNALLDVCTVGALTWNATFIELPSGWHNRLTSGQCTTLSGLLVP